MKNLYIILKRLDKMFLESCNQGVRKVEYDHVKNTLKVFLGTAPNKIEERKSFEQVTRGPVEGLRIRRKNWSENYYWEFQYQDYFKDLVLMNKRGNTAKICSGDLWANDWEIFKQVTLSDKIDWTSKLGDSVSANEIKICVRNMKQDIRNFLHDFSYKNKLNPKKSGQQLGGVNLIINKNLGKKLL